MNKPSPIYITALSSVSSLGSDKDKIWQEYLSDRHSITVRDDGFLVSHLSIADKDRIQALRISDKKYKPLDETVLYALLAARNAVKQSYWNENDCFGINIGSSRGATTLFEKYHADYLMGNKLGALCSPTTTLGNISSWVAHDLQSCGPEISHSITCSSSLHSILNGVAWLQSGLCDKFLVGGSEAPLTGFTISQMQALGVYANNNTVNSSYPCRAMDPNKKSNSMVLGEGASVACMQSNNDTNALAVIEGIGYATEVQTNNTSISSNASCLQKAMKMALANCQPKDIDIIVTHSPGTLLGDRAELTAIENTFTENLPALTNNKWKLGHTLATSGMLNVELALLMLEQQQFISVPYLAGQKHPERINKIMVNAAGFGGNAVSIILAYPESQNLN